MAKIEKLTEKAKEHLSPGETIKYAVMGAYEKGEKDDLLAPIGVFIATENRIIMFSPGLGKSYDLEDFPYSNISSIEMSKVLMMGETISFFASGNKVKMKWIKSGSAKDFTNYVREHIGKKSTPTATVTAELDFADQLKKLADLKAAGIVTEKEFEAKKKQILGL